MATLTIPTSIKVTWLRPRSLNSYMAYIQQPETPAAPVGIQSENVNWRTTSHRDFSLTVRCRRGPRARTTALEQRGRCASRTKGLHASLGLNESALEAPGGSQRRESRWPSLRSDQATRTHRPSMQSRITANCNPHALRWRIVWSSGAALTPRWVLGRAQWLPPGSRFTARQQWNSTRRHSDSATH
jgi:hypothetical protein